MLTEKGVVRILSNPAYSPSVERPAEIARRLASFRDGGDHVFWPEAAPGRDLPVPEAPRESRSVNLCHAAALADHDATVLDHGADRGDPDTHELEQAP